MATWTAVKQYVKSNYRVADEADEVLKFIFSTSDGRSQMVLLVRYEMAGTEWIEIGSPIGKCDNVDLKDVLRAANEYVVGGVVLEGETLVLRHTVPLLNLDANELEDPLQSIVIAADAIEKKVFIVDQY